PRDPDRDRRLRRGRAQGEDRRQRRRARESPRRLRARPCRRRAAVQGPVPQGARGLEAAAVVADALIGTVVARYQITRKLGQGGTGGVYLGEQPAIGSRVAIKVLAAECARDPGLLDRFFSEARAVNLIKHENIVGVLD